MLKYSPALRDQPWVRYRVKDGEKGPMVWEVKHTRITVKDEKGLAGVRKRSVVVAAGRRHGGGGSVRG